MKHQLKNFDAFVYSSKKHFLLDNFTAGCYCLKAPNSEIIKELTHAKKVTLALKWNFMQLKIYLALLGKNVTATNPIFRQLVFPHFLVKSLVNPCAH